METLYDRLEVSRKASPEIIDKAYKTLAKKYHPDLQTAENKAIAEEKMKKINEAYSVLSDEQKRKEYDEKIELEESSKIETQSNQQTEIYEEEPQEFGDWRDIYANLTAKEQRKIRKRVEREANEEYRNRYEAYFRSLGYKVKHKWTRKERITLIIAIITIIILFLIFWNIPQTHNMMMNLYNDNIVIKIIVNIVVGFFNSIGRFFKTIFKL